MIYHSDIMRSALCAIMLLLIGLKLAESWLAGDDGWLSDFYPDPDYMSDSPITESDHSQRFFKNRERPSAPGPRCDACRAIAYRLDKAFGFAESQAGIKLNTEYEELDELSEDEVNVITSSVCTRKTFKKVRPFLVSLC